jgi:hypothetical protein
MKNRQLWDVGRMAVMAYDLNNPFLLCYAQFTTALPAGVAKKGG